MPDIKKALEGRTNIKHYGGAFPFARFHSILPCTIQSTHPTRRHGPNYSLRHSPTQCNQPTTNAALQHSTGLIQPISVGGDPNHYFWCLGNPFRRCFHLFGLPAAATHAQHLCNNEDKHRIINSVEYDNAPQTSSWDAGSTNGEHRSSIQPDAGVCSLARRLV